MIKNKMQYQVTSKKLAEFKEALAGLKEKNGVNPLLKEIQVNALIAQIEILAEETEEYELSKEHTGATIKAK